MNFIDLPKDIHKLITKISKIFTTNKYFYKLYSKITPSFILTRYEDDKTRIKIARYSAIHDVYMSFYLGLRDCVVIKIIHNKITFEYWMNIDSSGLLMNVDSAYSLKYTSTQDDHYSLCYDEFITLYTYDMNSPYFLYFIDKTYVSCIVDWILGKHGDIFKFKSSTDKVKSNKLLKYINSYLLDCKPLNN